MPAACRADRPCSLTLIGKRGGLRRRRWVRSACAAGGLLLLLSALGCSPSVKNVDVGDIEGLRKVAAAYTQAAARTGRPPSKPADLQPFLPKGENLEQLLASSRDGQPYVILWGVDPRPGKGGATPLVIGYEKKGKNGIRFVFLDMGVVSMTDGDFAKANFPQGRKPE